MQTKRSPGTGIDLSIKWRYQSPGNRTVGWARRRRGWCVTTYECFSEDVVANSVVGETTSPAGRSVLASLPYIVSDAILGNCQKCLSHIATNRFNEFIGIGEGPRSRSWRPRCVQHSYCRWYACLSITPCQPSIITHIICINPLCGIPSPSYRYMPVLMSSSLRKLYIPR